MQALNYKLFGDQLCAQLAKLNSFNFSNGGFVKRSSPIQHRRRAGEVAEVKKRRHSSTMQLRIGVAEVAEMKRSCHSSTIQHRLGASEIAELKKVANTAHFSSDLELAKLQR